MQQLKLRSCKMNSPSARRTKRVPPSPSLMHRGKEKLLNPLLELLASCLHLELKETPVINKSLLPPQLFDLLGGEINPIYSEISFALHENLSQDDYADPDSTDVVQNVIYDIIQKGGEAGKISKGSKKLKLDRGILLDNYVQRGPILVDAQSRSLLIHSKRSKRHMSLKQHKKCGSFDLHDKFRR
ncbi:unnamed protein product [Triticum turgidum subsp. durum]|uniref:Uncharacterized protein n=1 Tax=Triticum turgidum subsp. durum TaxID=4567 RepID=A0A9R0QZ68_TRITD|nr:unnamed protein product [Triticum turgidum subsp. durum]